MRRNWEAMQAGFELANPGTKVCAIAHTESACVFAWTDLVGTLYYVYGIRAFAGSFLCDWLDGLHYDAYDTLDEAMSVYMGFLAKEEGNG